MTGHKIKTVYVRIARHRPENFYLIFYGVLRTISILFNFGASTDPEAETLLLQGLAEFSIVF